MSDSNGILRVASVASSAACDRFDLVDEQKEEQLIIARQRVDHLLEQLRHQLARLAEPERRQATNNSERQAVNRQGLQENLVSQIGTRTPDAAQG